MEHSVYPRSRFRLLPIAGRRFNSPDISGFVGFQPEKPEFFIFPEGDAVRHSRGGRLPAWQPFNEHRSIDSYWARDPDRTPVLVRQYHQARFIKPICCVEASDGDLDVDWNASAASGMRHKIFEEQVSNSGTQRKRKPYGMLYTINTNGIGWRSLTEEYLDSTGVFKDAVISILAGVAKQERI